LHPGKGAAYDCLQPAVVLWPIGRPEGACSDAYFAYECFAERETGRLEELRVCAVEDLIEARLALGRHAEVVGELESLIAEYPYRERPRAQLMLALYRSERQVEALQAYQDARHKLVEELGIEPGERLCALERAILAHDPALTFVDNRGPAGQPTADASRTAFVGREHELTALVGGLGDACVGRRRAFLLARRCSSHAAGRRVGLQRIGRGYRHCGRAWSAVIVSGCWPGRVLRLRRWQSCCLSSTSS
jgi:hypothetical protein